MSPSENSRINVLVVDDDDDTTMLVGQLLDRHGWEATFASSLAQARGILASGGVSVLLTDVGLPDGSGLSLLASGRPATLRAAIVMTGWQNEEEQRGSASSGFDAYLVKPVDGPQLVRLLENLLAPTVETPSPTRESP